MSSVATAVRQRGLSRPRRLMRRALRDYRSSWKLIIWTTSIIAVPIALFSTYLSDPTTDPMVSAYVSFAQLLMNVAVLYIAARIVQGVAVTTREAYYEGSGLLVRVLLESFILLLMLVPLLIGLVILATGVISPEAQLAGGEKALVSLLAALFVIPSVVLVARGSWALYDIAASKRGPIEAVKLSWRVSRGKTGKLIGRILALFGFLFLILLIPGGALLALQSLTNWRIFGALLQILLAAVAVPLLNLYAYRVYRELADGI